MNKDVDPVLQTFFRDKQHWVKNQNTCEGAFSSAIPLLVNGKEKYIQLVSKDINDTKNPLLTNNFLFPIHSAFLSKNNINTCETFQDTILSFVGEKEVNVGTKLSPALNWMFHFLLTIYIANDTQEEYSLKKLEDSLTNSDNNHYKIIMQNLEKAVDDDKNTPENQKQILIECFAIILFFNTWDRHKSNIMIDDNGKIHHIDIASTSRHYGLFDDDRAWNGRKHKLIYTILQLIFDNFIKDKPEYQQKLKQYINTFFNISQNKAQDIVKEIVRRSVNANPIATDMDILKEIKKFLKRQKTYLTNLCSGNATLLPQAEIIDQIVATNIDSELKTKIQQNITEYDKINDDFIKQEITQRKQIYQNTLNSVDKNNQKTKQEILNALLDGKVNNDVAEKNVLLQKQHYLALFNNFNETSQNIGTNNIDTYFFFSDTHGDLSLVFWSLYYTGIIEDFERDANGDIEFLYFDFEGNLLPNKPADNAQQIVVVPKPKINKNYENCVYHLGDFLDHGIENMASCFMLFYIQNEFQKVGKQDALTLITGNHELCYKDFQNLFGRREMTEFCKKQLQNGTLKKYVELTSPSKEKVFVSHCGRSEENIEDAKKNIDKHIDDYLHGIDNNPETPNGILQAHRNTPALFKQIYGHYTGSACQTPQYICVDNSGGRGRNNDKPKLYIASCTYGGLSKLDQYTIFQKSVDIISQKNQSKKHNSPRDNDDNNDKEKKDGRKNKKKDKKKPYKEDDEKNDDEFEEETEQKEGEDKKRYYKHDKWKKKDKEENNKKPNTNNGNQEDNFASLLKILKDDDAKDVKKNNNNEIMQWMLMMMFMISMNNNKKKNKNNNNDNNNYYYYYNNNYDKNTYPIYTTHPEYDMSHVNEYNIGGYGYYY